MSHIAFKERMQTSGGIQKSQSYQYEGTQPEIIEISDSLGNNKKVPGLI